MRLRLSAACLVALMISGCTTTEEANVAMKSGWIGRDSDDFFATFGPPFRTFELDNGGTIYSWRGGQTSRYVAAQYETVGDGDETRRRTVETDEDGNRTVRETTYRTEPERVMTAPPRETQLFCEAQITTDADGVIRNIGATRDTDGEGLSLSRCAEVFGAKAS